MGIESEGPKPRGYLKPALVARFSFWMTTVCVLVAVVVSILAIRQFMGTDTLWRTVATCAVIAAGTLAFSWINGLFDPGDLPTIARTLSGTLLFASTSLTHSHTGSTPGS
jgi:hypothetical protein